MKTAEDRWKIYLPNHDERMMRGFQAKKEVKLGNVCGIASVCRFGHLCGDGLEPRMGMKIRWFIGALLCPTLLAAASAPAADGPGQVTRSEPKAMTIRINPNDPSYTVLEPGSRVDVIARRKLPNGKFEARIVASRLKVVAVNCFDPKICKSVTLMVTQQQGMAISNAMQVGSVSLLVRVAEKTESR